MRILVSILAVVCAYAAVQQFEVATVRRSPPPPGNATNININTGTVRNGKLTFENASLSDCLKFAYEINSDDQLDGPDWMKSMAVRFDIVAQSTPETPRAHLELMLQQLLAERLQVRVHRARKVMQHLLLTVGKGIPKLSQPVAGGNNRAAAGRIDASRMSMQGLSLMLSRFERQTVVDGTALKGEFQFHLEWAPTPISGTASPAEVPAGPSIFTAVQEQLGLKLESRKGPVDALVVDHAEQVPADN